MVITMENGSMKNQKLKPTSKFGKRRLKAEQEWQKLFKNDKKKNSLF